MEKNNFRFWLNNAIKCVVATLVCNILGYLFYMFFLNLRNTEAPESASIGTAIFSIIIFVLSIAFTYRFAMWESNDSNKLDEEKMLSSAYKESNYTLNYNAYFKEQVKTRLWSYYLVAALIQIPLIVNYYLAIAADYGNIYRCPIGFYKFSMTSIFAYELFGKLWFIGPIVYVILFSAIVTFLIYRGQKKWMVKPSYIK